jgi:hypothetical protein
MVYPGFSEKNKYPGNPDEEFSRGTKFRPFLPVTFKSYFVICKREEEMRVSLYRVHTEVNL